MKDFESLHLKVQEQIDCFSTTDPLKEMSEIQTNTEDADEEARKWLALVVIHGINENAKKITLKKSDDATSVKAKYRKSELPSPGNEVGERILQTVREILHAEDDKEKSLLSLSLGGSDVTLKVKVEKKDGESKIKFKFPKD